MLSEPAALAVQRAINSGPQIIFCANYWKLFSYLVEIVFVAEKWSTYGYT